MKIILKVATAATLLSGLIFAQGQFGPRSATPPDPATIIAREVARLTTLLDLTSTQATDITNILTSAQSSIAPIQTTLSTDRTSLTAAITSNNTASIGSLSASIGTAEGQILGFRSAAAASIYAALTAAQQTKLNSLGGVGILGGGGPGGGFGGRGPGMH
jgi:Spy/CpxP family protein refolding chaperone